MMGVNTLLYIVSFLLLVLIYFTYKKTKNKNKIKKDYNRKINKHDTKILKDLSILRKELLNTTDPKVRNEIIRKIDSIVKLENKK